MSSSPIFSSFTATLFGALFVFFAIATLLVKGWLANKQMKHVRQHRHEVPSDFTEHVSISGHQLAADYTLIQQRFGLRAEIFGVATLLFWTVFGGLNLLNHILQPLLGSGLSYGIALILVFTLINSALDLPESLWSTFKIEQRFGFNKMTLGLWIKDLILSTLVGLVIGVPLIALILWLMNVAGTLWWLWAWGAFALWQLLLMVLFPVLIAPLFNKFKPLEDEALLTRVTELMQRCGFKAKGFFVMDGSKRSSHSNAYFTGMGKSKRVVFYDTLLAKLSGDEMEAVLAHELGHFHHRHITKRIAKVMFFSLVAFAVLGWLSTQPWFYAGLGVEMNTQAPNDALALLLFMLAAPVFMFAITPFSARSSRKDEFEADAYACKHANGPALKSSLLKLFEDNASTLTPDPLFARFYYSHPPAVERLSKLK